MHQSRRLAAAWFVYETVLPLLPQDGWRRVEHRPHLKHGYRETVFVEVSELHRATAFQLGAFGAVGYWHVSIELGQRDPTWGVVEADTGKTFIITPYADRNLGRPITYSLPTDDIYPYPGDYVTSC